jgi:hypothetical protein
LTQISTAALAFVAAEAGYSDTETINYATIVHGCTRLYIHASQHQNKVNQIELTCTAAMEKTREIVLKTGRPFLGPRPAFAGAQRGPRARESREKNKMQIQLTITAAMESAMAMHVNLV